MSTLDRDFCAFGHADSWVYAEVAEGEEIAEYFALPCSAAGKTVTIDREVVV
jgi:hypothetical protein